MSPMARKLRKREVEAGIRLRRFLIRDELAKLVALREGLIYTRRGVLDMTRRYKLEDVVIDRFGQRIGGARAW